MEGLGTARELETGRFLTAEQREWHDGKGPAHLDQRPVGMVGRGGWRRAAPHLPLVWHLQGRSRAASGSGVSPGSRGRGGVCATPQALPQLPAKRRALPGPWAGVQAESFRLLGARMLKIFALAGGALRPTAATRSPVTWQQNPAGAVLGIPGWPDTLGNLPACSGKPGRAAWCCGWGHSGAGLLPKARQPAGRLLSHGAQLSALSSSPGAVTRGCGQR